ncbi:hypothetical protein C8R44DRAFT_738111 [Mycena epipterygia]|nr:hypothetical protein C8R44DRAFT_738111 [Mycena epipterygia]
MPKKRSHILARLGNLAKTIVEKLSPRKKRKVDGKENVSPRHSTSPSEASMDPVLPHNTSDVFLVSHLSDAAQPPLPFTHTGIFRATASLGPLASPPEHSFYTFTLPPPPNRRATVEEVPDEDDISVLAGCSGRLPLDSDDDSYVERELHTEEFHALSYYPSIMPPQFIYDDHRTVASQHHSLNDTEVLTLAVLVLAVMHAVQTKVITTPSNWITPIQSFLEHHAGPVQEKILLIHSQIAVIVEEIEKSRNMLSRLKHASAWSFSLQEAEVFAKQLAQCVEENLL